MAERKTGLPVDPTSPPIAQIISPFVPMSYQVDRPYSVNTQEVDGGLIYSETPQKVSDPQFAVPPVITGGIEFFKQFLDDPTETAGGIATAIGEEIKAYPERQVRTALAGGETINPETGEIERYDPLGVPATTALGTAASIARVADDGSTVLGMIAGRNSTSGRSRENMAKEQRKMGKSEQEIYRSTGAYFDSDVLGMDVDAFRHEIPNAEKSTLKIGKIDSTKSSYSSKGGDYFYSKDRVSFGFKPDVSEYQYNPETEELFYNPMPKGAKFEDGSQDLGWNPKLGDILDYPELFEEYPQLRDLMVVRLSSPSVKVGGDTKRFGGFYLHDGPRGKPVIALSDSKTVLPEQDFQSKLLHEVQHAIQAIEATPGGGEFIRIYEGLKDRLGVEGDSDYVMGRAIDFYESLYGEVEARIVQQRFLNPELKKESPVQTRKKEAADTDIIIDETDAVDVGEQAIRDELEYGDVSYEEVYPEQFKKDGGVVSLLDKAQNMNRGPKGVASLSSIARNMNRPMVSMSEGGTVSSVGPSAEARDQAARMTLIEMQMEPGAREIFDNNPYARIGLDILERGEYPDKETADMGARLTALIVGEGDVIPSGLRGLTVPSYALSTDALGADEIPSGLDSRGSSKQTSPAEALAKQGVTDGEMPRDKGSTAYFLASGEPDEKMAYTGRRRTLQIIAHELGHLGYMALQRSNRQKIGNPLYEADEFTLDVKDYESSRRMGIKPMADDIRAYENLTSDKELIPGITRGEYNRALLRQQERDAINLMRERGMPLVEQGPPEPPPEPEKGIGAKFLELLGLQ